MPGKIVRVLVTQDTKVNGDPVHVSRFDESGKRIDDAPVVMDLDQDTAGELFATGVAKLVADDFKLPAAAKKAAA